MRWERVFADLEAQVGAQDDADRDAEAADRVRTEQAALGLLERLLPHEGAQVGLDVLGAGAVDGVLEQVTAAWLLVRVGAERVLVPAGSVLGVRGLSRRAEVPADSSMTRRLGLGTALRSLVRGREPVRLVLVDGATRTGTLDRVGADHVDLAEHPLDLPRVAGSVTGVRTVPWQAIACVRSS